MDLEAVGDQEGQEPVLPVLWKALSLNELEREFSGG